MARIEEKEIPTSTKLQPTYDRLIVAPLAHESEGVINFLDIAQGDRTRRAKVIAAGDGLYLDDGRRGPMDIHVGDTILFIWGTGIPLEREDDGLIMLRQNEVLAKE